MQQPFVILLEDQIFFFFSINFLTPFDFFLLLQVFVNLVVLHCLRYHLYIYVEFVCLSINNEKKTRQKQKDKKKRKEKKGKKKQQNNPKTKKQTNKNKQTIKQTLKHTNFINIFSCVCRNFSIFVEN
jgi:hypothetical protein